MSKGKITEKQKAFCLAYLKDFNATQAAITAGYTNPNSYLAQKYRDLKRNRD